MHLVTNLLSDELGDKFAEIQEIDNQAVLFFVGPVISDNDEVIGGMAVGIRLDNLVRQLNTQVLSSITIFDFDGGVISSSFRDSVINQLTFIADPIDDIDGENFDTLPIAQGEIEGVAYQSLYAPLQVRSRIIGVLTVSLPVDFITNQISTSRDTFLVVFGVLFFMISVLGLLVARSITRPIFRMVQTTRKIRTGDYSSQVNLNTTDELGELALSFDHMTAELITTNYKVNRLYREQLEEKCPTASSAYQH